MPTREPYIALVGFPARDTKRMRDGTVSEALGGVLFSALAMAALARPKGFDVVPIIRVGHDIADEAERLLLSAGCSLEAVHRVDAPTQHSTITFTGPNDRWERVEGRLPSLTPEHLAPWLTARAFAVNFITGVEIDLATFRWLRRAYRGPIVMDYHTLALATLPDGRREPRRRADWAAWMEPSTVVQMNQPEAEALAGRGFADVADCMRFARQLLLLGPQAAVITLGERGAVGAERPSGGSTRASFTAYHVPAEAPDEIVDTVGCGDVFLAALTVGWACWESVEAALRFAVRAAGAHCGYSGLEGIESLSEVWRGYPAPSRAS